MGIDQQIEFLIRIFARSGSSIVKSGFEDHE